MWEKLEEKREKREKRRRREGQRTTYSCLRDSMMIDYAGLLVPVSPHVRLSL